MDEELRRWAEIIGSWAALKREVGEVWFFGSRARGDARPDSDLDVAIVMRGPERPSGERYGDWMFLASAWEAELQALLPVQIDLDIGDADISETVVGPTLKREGIRVFASLGEG